MTEEEIIEGNKLIAEFKGFEYNRVVPSKDGDIVCFELKDCLYHSSWDWLMPAVEKISKHIIKGVSPFNSDQFVRVEIVPNGYVKISNLRDTPIFKNISIEGGLINATWYAVVDFINWYNLHNPSTPTNDK